MLYNLDKHLRVNKRLARSLFLFLFFIIRLRMRIEQVIKSHPYMHVFYQQVKFGDKMTISTYTPSPG